jgi:hypothetical protein
MSRSRTNFALNVLSALLASYGWVSFFCFLALQAIWMRAAPFQPNEALGLVYRHNEHGGIVYFSAFQATAGALMFMTSIPLFFLAMWLRPKTNVQTVRGWMSIRATWDQDDPAGVFWWAAGLGAVLTPPAVVFVGPYIIRALVDAGFILSLG